MTASQYLLCYFTIAAIAFIWWSHDLVKPDKKTSDNIKAGGAEIRWLFVINFFMALLWPLAVILVMSAKILGWPRVKS